MMSLDFSDADDPGTGPVAQISCGRYIPPAGRRRSATGRWPRCRFPASDGIAFVDLPSTLIWFDEAGRTRSRWKASVPWASSC